MTEQVRDPAVTEAADLLTRYSFDLGVFSVEQLITYWLRSYPSCWLRTAIIEALYQGRYKAVSVGQILSIWKRRGQPIHHYNYEFEGIVCDRFSTTALLVATGGNLGCSATGAQTESTSAESAPLESRSLEIKAERPMGSTDLIASPVEPGVDASNKTPVMLPELGTQSANAGTSTAPECDRSAPAPQPSMPQPVEVRRSPRDQDSCLPVDVNAASLEPWHRGEAAKQPIHQFVPEVESSLFYLKLRAVALDELPSPSPTNGNLAIATDTSSDG